jgi:phospholipase/carboxylesterase
VIPQLGVVDELGVRVILPHAPHMPVTVNNGMVMPAWYDIRGNDFGQAQDEQGIRASAARLEALITRETERGISPERIVLAGFSQGGAIALYTGLRHAKRLGGLLALSTYLPMAEHLASESAPANCVQDCS